MTHSRATFICYFTVSSLFRNTKGPWLCWWSWENMQ